MKRNFALFPFAVSLLTAAAMIVSSPARAGKIETNLERGLLSAGPDELVSVIIRPKGTLLGTTLKRQVAAHYATRAEQHRQAVSALQTAADASQPLILGFLASPDFAGRVAEVRHFWIDNIITARMTPSAIAEIASRADVDEVIALPAVGWVEPIEVTGGVAPSDGVGTAQPGLLAIKADSLWKMGYTGKGRLVASIDAGVDGTHFLLSPKWRGHNGYPVRESWFDPQHNDTIPRTFPGQIPTHGTNVMGMMVAMDTLISMDTLGVSFDAQWISAAAIDIQGNSIIEAMQWAADPDGDPNTEEDVPDVVNNSWGLPLLDSQSRYDSVGSCSDAFWNAIDNVEAAGAVMLFAAGNEGPHIASIRNPANRIASETNAFSVGMVRANSETSPITLDELSSVGPSTCDMLTIKPEIVAPGYLIRTTNPNPNTNPPGGFTTQTRGTSFAVPHVSGGVALLREYNPNATVDTIKWALLHGARHVDGTPSLPNNSWGNGFLDLMGAYRLMPVNNQPALYIKRDFYTRPAPGTSTSMVIVLRSQGPAVSNVSVTLVSEDSHLTITNPSASFGDFGGIGDTSGNYTDPFALSVAAELIPGEQLPVRFDITGSGGYARTVRGTIQVGPAQSEELFTHSAGNFRMTVSARGTFGLEPDALAPRAGGQGYLYGTDPMQSIFEGAFLAGTDFIHVSDNARNPLGFPDDDFEVGPGGRLNVQKPSAEHNEETHATFSDASADHPIGLLIEQRTFVDSVHDAANYLVVEYKIHNRSGSTVEGLRAGLYFDWDFPWSPADTMQAHSDSGGYDASAGVGWMNERAGERLRGVAALAPPRVPSYRYFDNNPDIYDGFTDAEKWQALSSGAARSGPQGSGDGSHLLGVGPFTIPQGEAITVAFAIIGDTTQSGMFTSATRARRLYGGDSLALHPSLLSFADTTAEPDTTPVELLISNGKTSAVSFTVSRHPDWASVAPPSGSVSSGQLAILKVIPSLVGHAAGNYTDTIVITTSDPARGSFVIPVILTIRPKELTLRPTLLSFTGTVGGSDPTPAGLVITNRTASSVSFTVSRNPDWASVAPLSGSISSADSATLVVSPSIGQRPEGDYTDTVVITTSDLARSLFVVPVTLAILPHMGIKPNPFNPYNGESVTMTIPKPINVWAVVYDLTGQRVRDLGTISAGGRIEWDGRCRSDNGPIAAEGVYFCRVEGDGGFSNTFTIVLKR